ncbi:hypothetical protein [Helicobacter sp. L8]|uniref:hypothetical protein n=1 Tax=Helicobacter sp. L8 TaxID=2316078 RepID=UPI001F09468E|nr:hypothetical protein [Helicobacter sp. L8]
MTRLISILLLISPLWAVSTDLIQQMQQARALMVKIYYKAFKERCDRVYASDMVYSTAMQDKARPLVKHLKAFVDHIPLLQTLQPKTPKQAQMIQALKALEMYNLFILLRDSTPEFYCENHTSKCKKMKFPKRVKPFDAKKHTLKFLRGIELTYTPLIEAYHQGLDFTDYLYHLQALQDKDDALSPEMFWMTMDTRADSLDMIKGPKTPTLRHYFEDFKSIDAHDDYMGNLGFQVKDDNANAEYGYKDFFTIQIVRAVGGVKIQDLDAWMAYYQAQDFAFLGDVAHDYDYESAMGFYWESVTHVRVTLVEDVEYSVSILKPKVPLAKAMQLTLTKNPTPCLQPQYLNKEARAVCLQVFKQHSYNPKPLQKYLKSLRLVSIETRPVCILTHKTNSKLLSLVTRCVWHCKNTSQRNKNDPPTPSSPLGAKPTS